MSQMSFFLTYFLFPQIGLHQCVSSHDICSLIPLSSIGVLYAATKLSSLSIFLFISPIPLSVTTHLFFLLLSGRLLPTSFKESYFITFSLHAISESPSNEFTFDPARNHSSVCFLHSTFTLLLTMSISNL